MVERQWSRTISFQELVSLLLKRAWLIIVAPLLCVGAVFMYQWLFFIPEFESTATLYILKQDHTSSNNYTNQDFSLALDVVNDCTYILKSHAVLDEVINSLALNMEYEDLYDCIETNNPNDTRILEVKVTTTSVSLSKEIADQVCYLGKEKIAEAMGFQQVNLYEPGQEVSEPCNKIGTVEYLLIGIAAIVIVCSALIIAWMLDDTLKTPEDIERYLGLSVLGNIPNANEKRGRNYGYYKVYDSVSRKHAKKVRREHR